MKKFLMACVILLVCCLSTSAAEFTQQQRETIQLEVEIFGTCIMEKVYPYVQFGFTTEYAVTHSVDKCKTEGVNLVKTLLESGATEEDVTLIMGGLMKQAVSAIDNARNRAAQERVDAAIKERSF